MNTINQIADKIRETLMSVEKSSYFTVYSVKGTEIKIRVGNHSANRLNNGGVKTLSFVTNRTPQNKSVYNQMIEEWAIDFDSMLTDTFQTIEQVLEWEDVSDDQVSAEELNFELC